MIDDMKKLLLIAPAVLLLLAGCHKDAKLQTKVFEQSASYALTEGAADSISVQVRLEYPVSGAAPAVIDAMTRTIIGQALMEDGGKPDIAAAVQRYIDVTVQDYRDTNLPLYGQVREEELEGALLSWEDQVSGYFSGQYKDIISYDVYAYSFTGGAHGLAGDYVMNFNLKDGTLVGEGDFFVPGYQEELSALLTAHLRESMPDEDSYNALFVKDIEPNGNFKVSEEGVTYIYGPYEIGPYYLGSIEVTVPWEELGTLVYDGPTEILG